VNGTSARCHGLHTFDRDRTERRDGMQNGTGWLRAVACAALVTSGAPGAVRASDATPATATRSGLDYAFRFATAVPDTKDRAKAQESVVNGYIDAGLLEDAERRASEIEGWRGGVALGRIAALEVRSGNTDRARQLLAKAERTEAETEDWGRDRVLAQVAEVRALLGEDERTKEIASKLISNDPRTYEGRATVAVAWALAAKGDEHGAERTMATLDDDVDLYVTWWRTEGYLDLADRRGMDEAEHQRLLVKARASAEGIDGWKQAEMLQKIAAADSAAGRVAEARSSLQVAEGILVALPRTMSLRGPLLADLARAWNDLDERERAVGLVAMAEEDLQYVGSVVERPAATARVAAGYAAVGKKNDSKRLLGVALDGAQALDNPRPRALALSAVCRETGRRGMTLDDTERSRLDLLLNGLGEVASRNAM